MRDTRPRSRAGLIANPVVPPRLKPIADISAPITTGLRPSAKLLAPINKIASTRISVPSISLNRLLGVERTAGAVQNTLSFFSGLSVPFQCGR